MEEELIYTAKEKYSNENEVRKINENVEKVMKELGGEVINSSYILSEGIPTEAYGYYEFPELGIVTTTLKFSLGFYGNILPENLDYTFSVNFLGFEEKTEKYNNIKTNLENALKRSGLNPAKT